MEPVYIDQVYELPTFDKIVREYRGTCFDIVLYLHDQEQMRIQSIPNEEKDRYVFSDGRTIDDMIDDQDWIIEDGKKVKIKYSKKEFMLWCGIPAIVNVNVQITQGNSLVKTVLDLLQAADYISLRDPDTAQMLGLLTTPEGGEIFTSEEVIRILAGEEYE
jgi:hypothetical protein